MEKRITVDGHFCVGIKFLEKLYGFTKSDDIGSLLGGMQLFENDQGTWDPAIWHDWIESVEAVLGEAK